MAIARRDGACALNLRDPASDVAEVFGVERGDVVAVAGAGGKTTLCFGLAHALVRRGWRVLTTTTTKIWPDDAALTERTLLRPTLGSCGRPSVSTVTSRSARGFCPTVGLGASAARAWMHGRAMISPTP